MSAMLRSLCVGFFSFIVLSIVAVLAPLPSHGEDEVSLLEIEVAPSTLKLDSAGKVVTVHTDIAYAEVAGGSVSATLSQKEYEEWQASKSVDEIWSEEDNQGFYVAKFQMSEIKDLVYPGVVLFTLTIRESDGTTYTGSETIVVK